MDAVLFMQETERMKKTDLRSYSDFANISNPHEMVAFVARWSISHPKKTRAQDFFEKYPKANSIVVLDVVSGSEHRIPVRMCPCQLGYFKADEICPRKEHLVMDHTRAECVACWLKPIKE